MDIASRKLTKMVDCPAVLTSRCGLVAVSVIVGCHVLITILKARIFAKADGRTFPNGNAWQIVEQLVRGDTAAVLRKATGLSDGEVQRALTRMNIGKKVVRL